METTRIIWQSRCMNHETVKHGAERFIKEYFGVERRPIFSKTTPGEFRFADGYHIYLLTCEASVWCVRRTEGKTPAAKARIKAKAAARAALAQATTGERT